jgi:hypothetical protein
MCDEATEMRKQFGVYADAITAFATVQLVGFLFLIAHGDCFAKNVLSSLGWTGGMGFIVNIGYLVLVVLCDIRTDKISKASDAPLPEFRRSRTILRYARYTIILVDLIATVGLPILMNQGWKRGEFFIDCKATSQIIRDVTLF